MSIAMLVYQRVSPKTNSTTVDRGFTFNCGYGAVGIFWILDDEPEDSVAHDFSNHRVAS